MIGWLLLYLILVNAGLFLLMGWDKRKSRRAGRRIPERRLLLLALLGGSAGGWMGMRIWRHKTKHAVFAYGYPLLTIVYALVIIVYMDKI